MILIVDIDKEVAYDFGPPSEGGDIERLRRTAVMYSHKEAHIVGDGREVMIEGHFDRLLRRQPVTIIGFRWPYFVILDGTLWSNSVPTSKPTMAQGQVGHYSELAELLLKDILP